MKRQRIFSMPLILGALLCLSFAPAALGQQAGRRLIVNSGVIRLGVGQILRITINGQAGNDSLNVQFRRMYYVGTSNGGIWKGSLAAQDTSAAMIVASDEYLLTDISQEASMACGEK